MRPKQLLPLVLVLLLIIAASVFVYSRFMAKGPTQTEFESQQRQLINALAIADRPFVALFPHATNKLITLYAVNKNDSQDLGIEIEYLSGNALKGGRSSIPDSASFPYAQGFLLGSCSAGGKCSFDLDITTGTVKTKLVQNTTAHVLRSNYTFVAPEGESATQDRKILFIPISKPKGQLIVGGSHGFIDNISGEPAMEPVYLAGATADKIVGKLTIVAPEANSVQLFDGEGYKPVQATKTATGWEVAVNHTPKANPTTIVRDDLKGEQEQVTLYLLGPFVAIK